MIRHLVREKDMENKLLLCLKPVDSTHQQIAVAVTADTEAELCSVSELAESMENQSNKCAKCAKCRLEKIKKEKSTGSLSNKEIAVLMERDPGKLGEILSDNQQEFLINMGPCQPKLVTFPTNDNIVSGKHNRFSSQLYKKYPHLEYSIHNDADFVSCVACSQKELGEYQQINHGQ
jgi:hypothetical protein